MKYRINIVSLNYNGLNLLKKHLPSLVASAKSSVHDCRVTVVDNCSVDGSVEYVREHFPEVHLYQAPKNEVLCSFNQFAETVDDDILILLNNDVSTDIHMVDPLADIFERNQNVFFISTFGDRSVPMFHWGIITAEFLLLKDNLQDDMIYTMNTGMGAFHRKKFLELGGYDHLYLPGRYEDLDICYRAYRRGWVGRYQPKSRITHEGQVSFNKYYSSNQIQQLVSRNSLIFMVKNVSDPFLLARFAALTCVRLAVYLVLFRWHMWVGFFEFLGKLPKILAARKKVKSLFRLSDRQVLQLFNPTA